jgi:hypothetical protein
MGGPIERPPIEVDKCYRTAAGEVRLVTGIDGAKVVFAARGPGHFLDWHEAAGRRDLTCEAFIEEAVEEVPYYWEPQGRRSLA